MANYAELDSNNVVINLWKVGNEYQDMGPPEVIDSGARWIYDWLFHHWQSDKRLRGTTPSVNYGRDWSAGAGSWLKQYHDEGEFRHIAPGVGDIYDPGTDRFLPASPVPHQHPVTSENDPRGGWVWNYSTTPIQLEPPVAYPDDGETYYWDSFNQAWSTDDGSTLGEKRTSKNAWGTWGPDPG